MMTFFGLTLISMGLVFDLLGCMGLLRFPDVYNRLGAATKCVTTGTCCILCGTIFLVGFHSAGIKSLLCIIFLLVTAPASAHAVARGALRANIKLCQECAVDKTKEV
jgi:multicomponent Na+:H+ antiporter subunit G